MILKVVLRLKKSKVNEEYDRIKKTLTNEYLASIKDDCLKFEVNRLIRIPRVGEVKLPNYPHSKLSPLQKIMYDLAVIYRMGYCGLTILSSRAILEALLRAKLKIQPNEEKSLYRQIEMLQLPENHKKNAHSIRMLGNLIAHWSTDVKTKKAANLLTVTLKDKYNTINFDVVIPEEFSQVMNENYLFCELIPTKVYSDLIQIASQLFPVD